MLRVDRNGGMKDFVKPKFLCCGKLKTAVKRACYRKKEMGQE